MPSGYFSKLTLSRTHAFREPHLDAEHTDIGGASRGGGGHGLFYLVKGGGGGGDAISLDVALDFISQHKMNGNSVSNRKSKTQMD